ncbi:uncharacterized protein [Macrobrachium rosenbergii]|uniref:uncharacterized protein n=1 Tax=Macrobrachium rosenbergii TaxID=79674 RepID=UPI0034D3DF0E
MSEVLPQKKGSEPLSETPEPLDDNPDGASGPGSPTKEESAIAALYGLKRSPSGTSTASTTSAASKKSFNPMATLFKNFPFHSDTGFGTMNPMYDESDGELPADLPSPIKPTVATSQSLPTMPLDTPPSGGPTTQQASNGDVCSTVPSVTGSQISPGTKDLISEMPPSPISQPQSPRRSKSESYEVPKSKEPISHDFPTPPNTPFSHPPSPSDKKQPVKPTHAELCDEPNYLYNPAMALRGQLYDILGYPVDAPNTPRPRKGSVHLSPDGTPRESKPFPSYPANENTDSVNGNGKKNIEDDNNNEENIKNQGEDKDKKTPPDASPKSEKLDKLEDPEDKVTACWSHRDRPKVDEQLQKKDGNVKLRNKQDMGNTQPRDHSARKSVLIIADSPEDKKPPKQEDGESKRRSLYEDLDVPMIDDEPEYRKTDTPDASLGSNRSTQPSEGLDLDFLSQTAAAELAEQLCEVTSEAGRLITKELKEGLDYLTKPENTLQFTWVDAVTCVISIGAFYFDLLSDCLVAFYMYDDPHAHTWFWATLALILLPLVLTNAFSLYWYWFDERACQAQEGCYRHPQVPWYVWGLRLLAHVTLQASVIRQIDIIYYGTKSVDETLEHEALVDEVMEAAHIMPTEACLQKEMEEEEKKTQKEKILGSRKLSLKLEKKSGSDPLSRRASTCSRKTGGVCARGGYVALWIHAERDAANVDLLLSLIQDAPLLILHLYILTKTLPDQAKAGEISSTIIMQILAMSASLLTLAWSVASFVRAVRLTEPALSNLSLLNLLLLTLVHFCSISGQVMGFGLFASQLLIAFFVIISTHWLAMSAWILIQLLCFPRTTCTRAVFAHDQTRGPCSRVDDIVYCSTMGLIYLFTFVDVSGMAPRTQSILYHIFRLIEEAVLLTFWFIWVDGSAWYHWLPLFLVPVFFGLTLLFDGLYECSTKGYRNVPKAITPQSV